MMHVVHGIEVSLVALGYLVLLATPCVLASRIDLDAKDSK